MEEDLPVKKTAATTEAQAVADLAAKPEVKDIDGVKFLVTPDGRCEVITQLLKKPLRQTGSVDLRDVSSFLAYAKAKAQKGSEIRLRAEGDIRARLIIDEDGWGEWIADYVPVTTESYDAWTDNNGQAMDQLKFAAFIESHIDDIHEAEGFPKSTDLLTFCSHLEDNRKVSFKKSVSLQDGRVELIYAEKASDAQEQKMQMYRHFQLALRPYLDRESTYAITANLRYRIRNEEIVFWYELKGLEAVKEKIRADIRKELEASNLPVYLADL